MAFPNDSTPFLQALMPKERWSLRRAEMDQNLAYQQAQTQMLMQEQAQQQATIQQQAAVDSALQRLPLEGPDKKRMAQFRNQQKAKLAKYIQENYKSAREFLEVEGPLAAQRQVDEILNSDVYLNGIQNTQNIAIAMEARKKGNYLVGGIDEKGNYQSGEALLADFYNGKRANFRYTDSYKPDFSNVYEHFGKMDNPANKFDSSAYVPRNEIENFLRSSTSPTIMADMVARGVFPSQVPYKRYSIQDAMKFNMDMSKDQMDMQYKQQMMGLGSLKAQKLQNELSGKVDGTGRTWIDIAIGGAVATEKKAFNKQEGEDYTIGTLGKTLDQYAPSGSLEFMRIGIPNEPMQKAIKGMAGTSEGGSANEMVFPDNGGYVLRLGQVPNRIVSVEGNIYAPPTELDTFKKGGRADGFVRAKVAISEDAADKLDLYNTTLWDTDTKKGRGKYTRDAKTGEMIFEGYIPVKGLLTNELLDLYGTKGALGGKYTTEEFSIFP